MLVGQEALTLITKITLFSFTAIINWSCWNAYIYTNATGKQLHRGVYSVLDYTVCHLAAML